MNHSQSATIPFPIPTTMSDDLAAIHEQTSAILEKLYDEKNQPGELDEDFAQEYFRLVQANLNLDFEARGPAKTDARLAQTEKGLIDVLIPSKGEKFVVSRLAASKQCVFLCETYPTNKELVKTLPGTSVRFGSDRGSGTYVMTSVKGFPNITIKSGKAVVTVSHTSANIRFSL